MKQDNFFCEVITIQFEGNILLCKFYNYTVQRQEAVGIKLSKLLVIDNANDSPRHEGINKVLIRLAASCSLHNRMTVRRINSILGKSTARLWVRICLQIEWEILTEKCILQGCTPHERCRILQEWVLDDQPGAHDAQEMTAHDGQEMPVIEKERTRHDPQEDLQRHRYLGQGVQLLFVWRKPRPGQPPSRSYSLGCLAFDLGGMTRDNGWLLACTNESGIEVIIWHFTHQL